MLHRHPVLRDLPVRVAEGLLDHVAHHVQGKVQPHLPVFDAGDGQQILHQMDEPLGIVVDVREDLLPGRGVQLLIVGEQVAGVAGDGGQRRPDVVGDGPQKVRPQLFVVGEDGGLLLLGGVAKALQSQGTFPQDGHEHAVFEGLEGPFVHLDADDPVAMVVDADGMVEGLGLAVLLRAAARDAPVLEHPPGHLLLRPILQGQLLLRPGHGEDHRIAEIPVLGSHVEDHVPIEEGDDLVGGDADDLLFAARLLQKLVGVEEDLGAERLMGGAAGVLLEAVG